MAKTINFVKNIACKAVLFGSESKNSNFSGEKRVFSWQGIIQRLGELRNPEGAPIPWEKEHSVLAIKLNQKEVEERLIRFQETDFHINKETYEAKSAKKLSYLFQP